MKSKILVVGLIALMLAGGLVLASCGSKCPDGGDCKVTFPSTLEGLMAMFAGDTVKDCSDKCLEKQVGTPETEAQINALLGKTFKCNC